MSKMITVKENKMAIREILERIYCNDIVESDGEISGIEKFILLQALVENQLKAMDLSYKCCKQENGAVTYEIAKDSSICATIILSARRTTDASNMESTIEMEACLKKEILISEREKALDLLMFLDKMNADSSTGVVNTMESTWNDDYHYMAKGIVRRQRYSGIHYPFTEITDELSDELRKCFTNLTKIDLLLAGKTTLKRLMKESR